MQGEKERAHPEDVRPYRGSNQTVLKHRVRGNVRGKWHYCGYGAAVAADDGLRRLWQAWRSSRLPI